MVKGVNKTIGFHVKYININVALMILKRLPDKVSVAFHI